MRHLKFGRHKYSVALAALVALVAVGVAAPQRLLTQRAATGSDCTRFAEPEPVAVLDAPDPHYDGTTGETVETWETVDDRTVEDVLAGVQLARQAQVTSANRSVEIARQEAVTDAVQATISFNETRSLTDALAVATQYGLVPTAISHAFLGDTSLFVGEVPAVDEAGVPRTPDEIVQEYRETVALQVEQVGKLFEALPSSAPQPPIAADVAARWRSAAVDGPGVVGVIAEGTVPQVAAIADATNLLVAVAPLDCDANDAVMPEAWSPMIAMQLTDRPEGAEVAFVGASPGPEGRGD